MFSDADPAVALDPKQQHRELTKLGIYSGIPVAVSCLPKTNNTLCIALIFLEKHSGSGVFCVGEKIFPEMPFFWSSKLQSVPLY